MTWIKLIMMGFFSATAITLFSYQGFEIYHAIVDYFNQK